MAGETRILIPDMAQRFAAVLGLGRSGLVAAQALRASDARVWAWDDDERARGRAAATGLRLVDLNYCDWSEPEFLLLSPGIPHTYPTPHPVAQRARAAAKPIIGDIELLLRAQPEATYVGITGTNGKSTTTALIGHVLDAAARKVQTGGNIGAPALGLAPLGVDGCYVLELSSYQLELTPSLDCRVAVLLNITPDHLDRHGGMDGYIAAKTHIFAGSDAQRAAIVGIDDAPSRALRDRLVASGHPRVIPISVETNAPGGIYARDGHLIDDMDGKATVIAAFGSFPALPGRHNWQNAAAAYASARLLGLAPAAIVAGIASFPGLAHRQERVGEIDGIRFVNDSKATNGEAAAKALASYENIYWIAGGLPKEGGLTATEPFWGPVRRAFLIGTAADAFAAALDGRVPYEQSGTLDVAVAAAYDAARRDGGPAVVLLSPACASFDQFANFEARGDAFRDAVATLLAGRQAVRA
ncbi:MAG: UDP-N-acetylmuramoyl-L-alanine--D-glutamate ligase [Dongiaceae bacterium]